MISRSSDQYEPRRCERGDGAEEKSGPERNALVRVLVLSLARESLGAVIMGWTGTDLPRCSLVQWVEQIACVNNKFASVRVRDQHWTTTPHVAPQTGMGLSSKSSGLPCRLRTFRTLILRLVWSIGSLQHTTTPTICCHLHTMEEAAYLSSPPVLNLLWFCVGFTLADPSHSLLLRLDARLTFLGGAGQALAVNA